MKRIIITAFAAAFIGTATAQVHDRDSASNDYNYQRSIEQTEDEIEEGTGRSAAELSDNSDSTGSTDVQHRNTESGVEQPKSSSGSKEQMGTTEPDTTSIDQEGYGSTGDDDKQANDTQQKGNRTGEIEPLGNDLSQEADTVHDNLQESMPEAVDTLQETSYESNEERQQAANQLGKKIEKRGKKIDAKLDEKRKAPGGEDETKVSGSALLRDEVTESMVGPDGQTIYKKSENLYYYLDENGNEVMVTRSELKNKVEHK